jgi:hypothetical protein
MCLLDPELSWERPLLHMLLENNAQRQQLHFVPKNHNAAS